MIYAICFQDDLIFYTPLQGDLDSISLILALSIFYKRIISNFDAATKFTNRVFKYSEAVSVQLGTYELTTGERNKMTRVILQYQELLAKYSIEIDLFDYLETKELLRKIKAFKARVNENNG